MLKAWDIHRYTGRKERLEGKRKRLGKLKYFRTGDREDG
jgi:hypothetical protein